MIEVETFADAIYFAKTQGNKKQLCTRYFQDTNQEHQQSLLQETEY